MTEPLLFKCYPLPLRCDSLKLVLSIIQILPPIESFKSLFISMAFSDSPSFRTVKLDTLHATPLLDTVPTRELIESTILTGLLQDKSLVPT